MENVQFIQDKQFADLPKTSGVYLFYEKPKTKDQRPNLIYIGKAINLRDRVKNHFLQPSYRDNLFIDKVARIGFIETHSEIEALVLEAQLIKKHLPKFNVVWKDDKNYFYVAIEKNKEKIPYLFITHQKEKTNTQYLGPFVEGTALKKTLKYLRRVFPYYTTARHPKNRCTWCHLGLCPGPEPDLAEYKKNLKRLTLILQGKRSRVLSQLKKEMQALSRSQDFERAAAVRDRMQALERVMEHTHVIENQKPNTKYQKWPETQKMLGKIIDIKSPISRVECYDISNNQGKLAVGSMVVFVDGSPEKSQYKKFRIRMPNEPNDIAMLKEVFQRRLAHAEWPYPEVMLIDGGKAQLNAAIEIKNQKPKTKIKVISIAKGRQELFIEGKKDPIPLKDLPQPAYNLIKHLDDEAHRFAITYHKKLRKKALGLDKNNII